MMCLPDPAEPAERFPVPGACRLVAGAVVGHSQAVVEGSAHGPL